MLLLPRLCWILSVIVDWGGLEFAVLRHDVFRGSGGMETLKLRDGVRIVLVLSIRIFSFNLSIKIILEQKCRKTIDYDVIFDALYKIIQKM